jgi:hypothetical protein
MMSIFVLDHDACTGTGAIVCSQIICMRKKHHWVTIGGFLKNEPKVI